MRLLKFFTTSIQRKLFLIVGTIAVIPILFLLLYTYAVFKNASIETHTQVQSLLTEKVNQQIKLLFNDALLALEKLSDEDVLGTSIEYHNQMGLNGHLYDFVNREKIFSYMLVCKNDGTLFSLNANPEIDAAAASQENILYSLLGQPFPYFESVDQADLAVIDYQHFLIGKLESTTMLISHPIIDFLGDKKGVLIGVINWALIDTVLTQAKQDFLERHYPNTKIILYEASSPHLNPETETLRQLIESKEQDHQIMTYDRQHWISYRKTFAMGNKSFSLVSFISESTVVASTQKMLRTTFVLLLFCICLAGFISLFMSRKIVGALSSVVNALKDLAAGRGDISQRITAHSADEVGVLADTFNKFLNRYQTIINQANMISYGDYSVQIQPQSKRDVLAISLANMTQELQKKDVKIRSQMAKLIDQKEIIEKNKKEIDDILESIDQGIFTVNLDLTLNKEHSRQAEALFTCSDFSDQTLEKLLGLSPQDTEAFQLWLKVVAKPRMLRRWHKCIEIVPIQEMVLHDLVIKLDYQPIVEKKELSKIMILAKNITHQRAAEKMVAKTKREHELQMQRVMNLVNQDQGLLNTFLNTAQETIAHFFTIEEFTYIQTHLNELYRDLHTLKGTGGSFGFMELAKYAGKGEDFLSDLRDNANAHNKATQCFMIWNALIDDLKDEFENILAMRNLIFKQEEEGIFIQQTQYQTLLDKMAQGEFASLEDVFYQIYYLDAKPLEKYAQKYFNIVNLYLEQHTEKACELKILTPKVFLHRKLMQIFDPALIHLVRNCLDHGIEDQKTRENLGKGTGQILLSATIEKEKVKFVIADDGQGIDTQQISKRAISNGLITPQQAKKMSKQDKLQLIFKSGFSTKDEVSVISGRGIGMDVVHADITKYHGGVEITTTKNKGTTFILWVPANVHMDQYIKNKRRDDAL